MFTPARVSALLAAAATLAAALSPAVANLDTTSTAGLLGGAVVILGILETFLKGQRAHEAGERDLEIDAARASFASAAPPVEDEFIPPSSDAQLLEDGILEDDDVDGTVQP